MADRYSRTYIDEKERYFVGSSIILSACALLNDNKTGGVIAQIKLRRIGNEAVKAVTVNVKPFDTAGRPLGESIKHSFLDLDGISRDSFFGSQTPIPMPDSNTRSIEVSIGEVIYSDKIVKDFSGGRTAALPSPVKLSFFDETALLDEYRRKTCRSAVYIPNEFEDLWSCTCGAINLKLEKNCHSCGVSLSAQTSALDTDALRKEAREKEYERKSRVLKEARAQMNKDSLEEYENALSKLVGIKGFEDADELAEKCEKAIAEIKENERKEKEKRERKLKEAKTKKKWLVTIISLVLCTGIFAFFYINYQTKLRKNWDIREGILYEYKGTDINVTIPDSVTEIGYGVFYGKSIKSVTIPDSVTLIHAWAFYSCTSLDSVSVPKNCLIETDAFDNHTKIIYR